MRVSDIMSSGIAIVRPTDSIQLAAAKMRDDNIGFLPVCEDDRTVLGALTDRDIVVRGVAAGRELGQPVREIMTHGALTCRPDDELDAAEDLMRRDQVERVIVVDEHRRAVGILSLADIAQFVESQEAGEALRAITEREAPSPF